MRSIPLFAFSILASTLVLTACNGANNKPNNNLEPGAPLAMPANTITVDNYLLYIATAEKNLPQLDTNDFPLHLSTTRDTQEGAAATQMTMTNCDNDTGQLTVISHEAENSFDNYVRAEYNNCLLSDIQYSGSVETSLRDTNIPLSSESNADTFVTTYKSFEHLHMANMKGDTYLTLDGGYETSVKVTTISGVNIRLNRDWLSDLIISHNLNGEAVSQQFTDFSIEVTPGVMRFSGNVKTDFHGVDYAYHIDLPLSLPMNEQAAIKAQPFVTTITTQSSQLILRREGNGLVADLDENGDGIFDFIGMLVSE